MKKKITVFLKALTNLLEFVIAALLAVGIIIITFQLFMSIDNLTDLSKYPNYDDLLTLCFNLIIGVEMIRMLYLHTPMTVFEVLLFAIARQIIIEHASFLDSFLGILAVAVLFGIRRFLFMLHDEKKEKDGAE